MNAFIRPWLIMVLIGLLSACATRPVVRTDVAQAESAQRVREAWVAEQSTWSLSGRLAVSDGRDNGSGQLIWAVSPAQTRFEVRAPISRQTWRLTADAKAARLEGLEGGVRHGRDAAALLEQELGWSLPLTDLSAWARGARGQGSAQIAYANDGLPARIIQDGWTIEYRDWYRDREPAMPRRVFAQRGEQRVRLVVEDWSSMP